MTVPEFNIRPLGKISEAFLRKQLVCFSDAAQHIRSLRYGRIVDSENELAVLDESTGTCSSKHLLLKRLAEENDFHELKLCIGIFRMNALNTPAVAGTLQKHHLGYIPEAHTYFRYKNVVFDFTSVTPLQFESDLLEEQGLDTHQFPEKKILLHRKFLKEWIRTQDAQGYNEESVWKIREQCILDLSQ